MSSITKTAQGTWRARWRTPEGEARGQTFRRKVDAENHLTSVSHAKLTGAYIDPAAGKVTFAELRRRYLLSGAWRENTRRTADERTRAALDEFGPRAIASIRRSELQSFLDGLTLAASTKAVVRQHVSAVFELAVTDRLIVANPAKGLKVPKRDMAPVKPIEGHELQALLDGAPPSFRAAIVLGAGLGLRLGEAAGLSVDRVDFLRRTVRVDRQWQQLRGTVPGAFVPPKSASSARVIPAAQGVLDELARHIEQHGRGQTIVHADGAPLSAPQWEYQMRVTRKRAGLSGLTFHDLRHHYASALISAGCSVKAVQTALGHASAAMTLDVYGHLWPGDEDRIRAAVEGVFIDAGLTRGDVKPSQTVSTVVKR